MTKIGERIYSLRTQHNMTQETLAELLGVSRQTISKWELSEALPETEKIIRMSGIFSVPTDKILLPDADEDNSLHLGSIYLVVKDFEKSVAFYEALLGKKADGRCKSGNQFVEFYFDNQCIALMNEGNLAGHNIDRDSVYKFVLNFYVNDLNKECERIKALNIGRVTEIMQANPSYHYIHLFDPDNNVIEITGGIA